MTSPSTVPRRGFALLRELQANNTREWYRANKAELEESLIAPFARVLEHASELLRATTLRWSGDRDTMFRLQRDVRFTRDKTPYKTEVSGLITPDGTRSASGVVMYLACADSGGQACLGVYRCDPGTTRSIRGAVRDREREFLRIASDLEGVGRRIISSDSLVRMPRGFEGHSDTPVAPYLKMKDMLVVQKLTKTMWQRGDVPGQIALLATEGAGLARFLAGLDSEPAGKARDGSRQRSKR